MAFPSETTASQMRFNLMAILAVIFLALLIGFLPPKKTGTGSVNFKEICTQGIQCQFPFIFNGNIYTSCTTDGASGNKSWCSTKVNSEGFHQEGFWSYCNEFCQKSVRGLPLHNRGDCPNQLLAMQFEVSDLNGIYLLSEFGLKNGRVFYSLETDPKTKTCIWWQTDSSSWNIGDCSGNGFATLKSSENCPSLSTQQSWILMDSSSLSSGSLQKVNISKKPNIAPVVVKQKVLFWKSMESFDWAASCRFQTKQTTALLSMESDCKMKCLATENCTHFDWCYYAAGQCVLREGPVSKENATYVNDISFTCGIVKKK